MILLVLMVVCCGVKRDKQSVNDVQEEETAAQEDPMCRRIKKFYMAYKMQGEKDFVVYFSLEKLDLLRKYCTKRLYDIQVNEIENSDGFDIVTDNVRKTNYTEQSMVVRKDSGFYQVNFNAEDGIPVLNIYMKGDSIDRVVNPKSMPYEELPCDVMTYAKVKCPVRTGQLVGTRWKELDSGISKEWEFSQSTLNIYWRTSWDEERTKKYNYYIDSSCPDVFDSSKVGKLYKGAYIVYTRDDEPLYRYRVIRFDLKKGEMMLYRYRPDGEIGGLAYYDRETYIHLKRVR